MQHNTDEKPTQGSGLLQPPPGDVILRRDGAWIHTNVPRIVVEHSPDGFEWGYAGSGPADLALNILAHFIPCPPNRATKCYRGECSPLAYALHQEFKSAFIATVPHKGGILREADIRHWIHKHATIGH